ncbi:hypothetical protein GCM10022243_07470 [Saccharothrix violaceirubra]|uniref:SCP1.201-like deaminase n=1 Tax=Saccharothrix violaceirubra TaxID=413306 RepID=A0A7W7SYB1_9PSEU|nr:DddA-like double-stranded DNA deaminase toxin [Saccharothrix violaceirubra]MBB4963160.1 hypothetical protein [Saccharothrix violaceirubra]
MASLSDVAHTLRTAADTLPVALLAHTTTGTSDPEVIATTDTFAEAYRRCTELLQTAQALHTHINTLADHLAPLPSKPPGRDVDRIRQEIPAGVRGARAQGRWLGPGTDSTVLRSGSADEWHRPAFEFLAAAFGRRAPELELAKHMEIKLAVRMRTEGRRRETLVIDRMVCGREPHNRRFQATCDKILKYVLPPGATLTVIEHDGTPVTYRGVQ